MKAKTYSPILVIWRVFARAPSFGVDKMLSDEMGASSIKLVVCLESAKGETKSFSVAEKAWVEKLWGLLKKCPDATGVHIIPDPATGFGTLLVVHENDNVRMLKLFGKCLISPVDGSVVLAPTAEQNLLGADRPRIFFSNQIAELLDEAKRQKQNAVKVTTHGSLHGEYI